MSSALGDHLAEVLARAAESANLAAPSRAEIATLAGRRRRQRRVRNGVVGAALATLAVAGAVTLIDEPAGRTVVGHEVPTTGTAPTTPPPTSAPPTSPSTTPAAPAATGARPVVESLALRGDGVGPFDFGAPRDAVVAAVTAELGRPVGSQPMPGPPGCQAFAATADWPGLALTFEGRTADSLVLTQWLSLDLPGNARRLRMQDGPALGDPQAAWQAAYGSRYERNPAYGDNFVIHLAGGDVIGSALTGQPPVVTSAGSLGDCVIGG